VQIIDHGAVEASLPLCGWPAGCDRRSARQTETAATSAPLVPNPAGSHALPLVFVSRSIRDRVPGSAEIVGAQPKSLPYRLVHCCPVSVRYSSWASAARVPVMTSSTLDSATLGAEFLVATGGDLVSFGSPGQLASYAGHWCLYQGIPAHIIGNLHRPKRYNRRLRRVFYMAALSSIRANGPSR
jgi:hypothetical protein